MLIARSGPIPLRNSFSVSYLISFPLLISNCPFFYGDTY